MTALRYNHINGGVAMVRLTIRIPDELHEKLRWYSFKERRSQQVFLLEIIEKALADVKVPEEESK